MKRYLSEFTKQSHMIAGDPAALLSASCVNVSVSLTEKSLKPVIAP